VNDVVAAAGGGRGSPSQLIEHNNSRGVVLQLRGGANVSISPRDKLVL
jgi:hypothetical protein